MTMTSVPNRGPADLAAERLPETVKDVGARMLDYLDHLDVGEPARARRHATEKEANHATL